MNSSYCTVSGIYGQPHLGPRSSAVMGAWLLSISRAALEGRRQPREASEPRPSPHPSKPIHAARVPTLSGCKPSRTSTTRKSRQSRCNQRRRDTGFGRSEKSRRHFLTTQKVRLTAHAVLLTALGQGPMSDRWSTATLRVQLLERSPSLLLRAK